MTNYDPFTVFERRKRIEDAETAAADRDKDRFSRWGKPRTTYHTTFTAAGAGPITATSAPMIDLNRVMPIHFTRATTDYELEASSAVNGVINELWELALETALTMWQQDRDAVTVGYVGWAIEFSIVISGVDSRGVGNFPAPVAASTQYIVSVLHPNERVCEWDGEYHATWLSTPWYADDILAQKAIAMFLDMLSHAMQPSS